PRASARLTTRRLGVVPIDGRAHLHGSLHTPGSVTAQRAARRDSLGRVGGISDLLVIGWIQDATPAARHHR
ncbi:MAG: hypothetical protein ACREXQ_08520, partial [Polaromonas sp.]